MQRIISPINTGDSGAAVDNLHSGLFILFDQNMYHTFQPPETPTKDELDILFNALVEENASGLYGKSTRQLIFILQIQQGLGDGLNGAIEETTASAMNKLLSSVGAFDVQPEKDTSTVNISYTTIIPILINAVKAQDDAIRALEKRVEELEKIVKD